jgi:hypothetical protein
MNKIIAYTFALLVLASPVFAAEEVPFFETKIQQIAGVEGTDLTLFYFSPVGIQDNSKIASWKVRFYCDEDMSMRFIDVSKDNCNKAVSFANTANLPNFILFENKNQETKKFTFALKAYDKNGKWIHTDRNNFNWK